MTFVLLCLHNTDRSIVEEVAVRNGDMETVVDDQRSLHEVAVRWKTHTQRNHIQ